MLVTLVTALPQIMRQFFTPGLLGTEHEHTTGYIITRKSHDDHTTQHRT